MVTHLKATDNLGANENVCRSSGVGRRHGERNSGEPQDDLLWRSRKQAWWAYATKELQWAAGDIPPPFPSSTQNLLSSQGQFLPLRSYGQSVSRGRFVDSLSYGITHIGIAYLYNWCQDVVKTELKFPQHQNFSNA